MVDASLCDTGILALIRCLPIDEGNRGAKKKKSEKYASTKAEISQKKARKFVHC